MGNIANLPGSSWAGTPEHAADVTKGRHQGVQDAMQWLCFSHLPEHLRGFSRPIYNAAQDLLRRIPVDGPELTTGLNTLVAAKDHMMRAGIRSDTGRAGSIPRPQELVDPPVLHVPAPPVVAPAARPAYAIDPLTGRQYKPIRDNPQA